MKIIRRILRVNNYILLLLSAVILAATIYINKTYQIESFEQLLYTFTTAEGTGMDSIKGGIITGVKYATGLFIVIAIPLILSELKYRIYFQIRIRSLQLKFSLAFIKLKLIYSVVILVTASIWSLHSFGFFEYLDHQFEYSKIYEEYYVRPDDVQITFPKKKQNLIYIYVESLETTNVSKENGGDQNISYIPNLERIALENINFSNTSNLGGALPVTGTGWTVAAMIAHSMGINMKVNIDGNEYKDFSSFLGGAKSIGDILKENGYKNYILMGSDAHFGGRDELFTQHGDYKILDLNGVKKAGMLDEDYHVWWGYEDSKLYDFAKQTLSTVSKNEEPFNITLLTVDTHFQDGYLEKSCPKKFENQYVNTFYCEDQMLAEFIGWVKKQDFYKDTTIVIVGDHLTMQKNFYEEDGYTRTVYNTIINSRVKPINEKNRLFSTMDLFPTTLAAMGAKIEGNKLALGVNLFSDEKTLIEKLGINTLNDELAKKSLYYDNHLLGASYYEIEEKKKNEEQVQN